MEALEIIKLIFTLIVSGASVVMFIEIIRRRLQYIRLGEAVQWKRKQPRKAIVKDILLHRTLLQDIRSGLLHLLYFYGFLSLQLGALDIMLKGLFHTEILPWMPLYGYFSWVQEWIVVLVLIAIGLGAYRRYGEKLSRLKRGKKPSLVYWFIGALMLSVLLTLSFERLLTGVEHLSPAYAPISSVLADGLIQFGVSEGGFGATIGYEISWWLHLLILVSFLIYVPQSKHFHLLVAPINLWLRKEEPAGKLATLDLENEEAESFGVGHVFAFNQKQLLDLYACVECGRCTNVCPAASTGKLLSPMHLIIKLRDHATEKGAAITSKSPWLPQGIWNQPPWGVGDLRQGAHVMQQLCSTNAVEAQTHNSDITSITATMQQQASSWKYDAMQRVDEVNLIGDVMTEQELWSCTTCRNCEQQCPVGNEHVDKIIDMRRHLVLMEGSLPSDAQRALQNIERQSNPWGISRSRRAEWIEDCMQKTGIHVPTMKELVASGKEAELLLWVGSMGSFDNRSRKLLFDLIRLLHEASVSFAVLGLEEKSSGDTARRIGNEMLYQQLAQENIETLHRYQVKRIVTPCPHTYHTFKNEYGDLGLSPNIEILHHSELLLQLLHEGRLIPAYEQNENIVYHDSCYLGRYNGIYDAPRAILQAIPGVELKEMERSHENAMCCGAGGGLMWMEEQGGTRVNNARAAQALAQEPSLISTACPYCLTMLEDGVKGIAEQGHIETKDVAEILAASVCGTDESHTEAASSK